MGNHMRDVFERSDQLEYMYKELFAEELYKIWCKWKNVPPAKFDELPTEFKKTFLDDVWRFISIIVNKEMY